MKGRPRRRCPANREVRGTLCPQVSPLVRQFAARFLSLPPSYMYNKIKPKRVMYSLTHASFIFRAAGLCPTPDDLLRSVGSGLCRWTVL